MVHRLDGQKAYSMAALMVGLSADELVGELVGELVEMTAEHSVDE